MCLSTEIQLSTAVSQNVTTVEFDERLFKLREWWLDNRRETSSIDLTWSHTIWTLRRSVLTQGQTRTHTSCLYLMCRFALLASPKFTRHLCPLGFLDSFWACHTVHCFTALHAHSHYTPRQTCISTYFSIWWRQFQSFFLSLTIPLILRSKYWLQRLLLYLFKSYLSIKNPFTEVSSWISLQ